MLAEANLDPGGGEFTRFVTSYSEPDFVEHGFSNLLGNLDGQSRQGDHLAAVAAGIVAVADPIAIHRSAVAVVRGTDPIMRELLVGMTIPRLYVFGDQSLPDPDLGKLPRSGVEVAVVPDGGHAMMMDNPSGFARIVGEFLDRHRLVED